MTLKFRRNLPVMLLLVCILSFLAIGIGDQRVVAYSLPTEILQVEVSILFTADQIQDTSTAFNIQLNRLAGAFDAIFHSAALAYTSQ